MSAFIDSTLVSLADDPQLIAFLLPPADVGQTRLRRLVNAVYDFPSGTLREIRDLQVNAVERVRPLFSPEHTKGTWLRTIPNHTSTNVVYERIDLDNPIWIDLSASLGMTLVLELDFGELQSIALKELDGITSLADFQSRFRFLDLNDFLAKHRITTVEELREAYHYLLAEVRLKPPGPFDPVDPANQHRYTLDVAIFLRDALDVPAIIREVKLVRLAAERSFTYQRETRTSEVHTPLAALVVVPATTLTGRPFNEAQIRAFLAAERIEIVFQP